MRVWVGKAECLFLWLKLLWFTSIQWGIVGEIEWRKQYGEPWVYAHFDGPDFNLLIAYINSEKAQFILRWGCLNIKGTLNLLLNWDTRTEDDGHNKLNNVEK